MGSAISSILTQAIGAAINPIPIITVILILLRKTGRCSRPGFLSWAGCLHLRWFSR